MTQKKHQNIRILQVIRLKEKRDEVAIASSRSSFTITT